MLTESEKKALAAVSKRLGVNSSDLYKLIKFESRWNPLAKNPLSSARGLIQIIDSRAREIGFKNSADMVRKCPTIKTQLLKPVYRYLSKFRPFPNKQALYMSVFLPAYRYKSPSTIIPYKYRKVNPGIRTIKDYVDRVEGKALQKIPPLLVLMGIGFLIYHFYTKTKGGKYGKEKSPERNDD